jgi:hypothetical protein
MMTGELTQLPDDGWGLIVLDKPNEMDWEVILVDAGEFDRGSIDAKVGMRLSFECKIGSAANLRALDDAPVQNGA